ncbi:glycosyltransferase family 4 protein [uncultured Flavobacterium sp.]|uniref:glycosyltransferase family 4 protein n=1 Tax=uncultured Flavobacterium sp. TaxID=165435 RepID=UPI0030EF9EBD
MKPKLIRTSTIALSLNVLLKGQLCFLQNHYNVVAVSGYDEDLKEVAVREKVHVHAIEMQRQISPLKDLISLIKLYLYFKKEKPQIVHSITPKAGLLSMIAAKYAGVPVRMHTFTGLVFPSKKGIMQRILILMDQLLCWHATNVFPEGQGVKKDLLAYEITNKPLKIIANGNVNGVDLSYFDSFHFSKQDNVKLREKLSINHDDFVFIFVGRLVSDKGINELVEAFGRFGEEEMGRKGEGENGRMEDEEIRRKGEGKKGRRGDGEYWRIGERENRRKGDLEDGKGSYSCKLLLVGLLEAELDPLLPETLKSIEENPDIISVGFQNDVRPYFAIADALVFPSYREGFPNVVLQAGAMGLPSIVSDINGCNEIIINGNNGLIIPVKNTGAVFEAMKKYLIDKQVYQLHKKNARNRIAENYEQKVVWSAILNEYKSLEENV